MIFAQDVSIVDALSPVASNAVTETAWVDVSDAVSILVYVNVTKGNAALTSFTLREFDGTTNRNLQTTVPVWTNLNTGASATMVRQTNAIAQALDNADDGRGQQILFQVDPAKISAGYDRIRLDLAATNAGNLVSVAVVIDKRNKTA